MAGYFRNAGSDIIFDSVYLEAYIPQLYYDRGIAEEYGECTKVMGLFNIQCFGDLEGKKTAGKLETVNIPTMINIFPTTYETREVSLIKNVEPEPYVVLKFYNNDIFTNGAVPQSSANCEMFLRLLMSGKVPNTIPYDKVADIWRRNMIMNGINMPDIPAVIYELIISEIYRNRKKFEERFGKTVGLNPKTSMFDYITANIRAICKYNSTFAGITFEDTDTMLTSALNTNKTGRNQTISPIEKIMKY